MKQRNHCCQQSIELGRLLTNQIESIDFVSFITISKRKRNNYSGIELALIDKLMTNDGRRVNEPKTKFPAIHQSANPFPVPNQ